MRISDVQIPAQRAGEFGLSEIAMHKLSDVVVIAGKNGAGKTRLIKCLSECARRLLTPIELDRHQQELVKALQQVTNPPRRFGTQVDSAEIKAAKQRRVDELTRTIEQAGFITTNPPAGRFELVSFVPTELRVDNPHEWGPSAVRTHSEYAKTHHFTSAAVATPARIKEVIDRWFRATHSHTAIFNAIATDQREQWVADYNALREIIRALLDVDLEFNSDLNPTLFGRTFKDPHLSHGQIVLLHIAVALFAKQADLHDMVLVLDEPETHLHPGIVIDVIERLRAACVNSQIWISTHSIPIIAQYASSLWLMESGSVQFAGTMPQRVLEEMLGSEARRQKLEELLSLPAEMAITNYTAEALQPPAVASPHANDPQLAQIRGLLNGLRTDAPLNVLDYGAGKGRLLASLSGDWTGGEEGFRRAYQYYAIDLQPEYSEECKTLIDSVYHQDRPRFFDREEDALSHIDGGSIACIVMSNVLHEIDPKDWLSIFAPKGIVGRLLSSQGALLVIEDELMPHGELAHRHGFLVLNKFAIQQLFQIQPSNSELISADARGDGRLMAYVIPKTLIYDANGNSRVTNESRIAAIEAINHVARERIKQCRREPPTYQGGRKLAYWLQQFANSQLLLDELGETDGPQSLSGSP